MDSVSVNSWFSGVVVHPSSEIHPDFFDTAYGVVGAYPSWLRARHKGAFWIGRQLFAVFK